jgi:type IV pilus assembly protein PilB
MADPTDLDRLDDLAGALRTRIVAHVATAGAIDVVLRKGDATQRVLAEAASGFRISLVRETEQGEEVLDLDRLATDSDMSPIIKLVDTIIYNAMESRASDIHIETRDTEVQVKYRIDGALYQKVDPIDLAYHQTLISRIKVMSELDIAERRVPQDGRFRVRYKGRNVDFRVSIMPTVHGEDAVIRILDKEQINEEFKNLDLNVVGFDPDDLRKFRRYIAEPYGMVLVTGPTGSGKTTTIASMIDHINETKAVNVVTIEDPIEVLHPDKKSLVNQREIGTDTRDYASAMKRVLRQDPDVIFIGEMRDPETVWAALAAAETGHLVISTLHTTNATETVNRIVDFFPPFQQKQIRLTLAASLRGVVSMRLLERADGTGRIPAVEVLVMTGRVFDRIIDPEAQHSIEEVIAEGEYYGMQTFDQSLFNLYKNGLVALRDALAVASHPHDFRLLLQQEGLATTF